MDFLKALAIIIGAGFGLMIAVAFFLILACSIRELWQIWKGEG